MDKLTRRALLRVFAGSALSFAGTVVLTRKSHASASATDVMGSRAGGDIQARAAALGLEPGPPPDVYAQFRNTPGGGLSKRQLSQPTRRRVSQQHGPVPQPTRRRRPIPQYARFPQHGLSQRLS